MLTPVAIPQPSAAFLHDLEKIAHHALLVMDRIMTAAVTAPENRPIPKPLQQARVAAAQVLRLAAQFFRPAAAVADPSHRRVTPAPNCVAPTPGSNSSPMAKTGDVLSPNVTPAALAPRATPAPPPPPFAGTAANPAACLIAAAGAPVGTLRAAAA